VAHATIAREALLKAVHQGFPTAYVSRAAVEPAGDAHFFTNVAQLLFVSVAFAVPAAQLT
jgi:hypothetical protein